MPVVLLREERNVIDLPDQYARSVHRVPQQPSSTSLYENRLESEEFDGDFDQRHTLSLFGRYRISDRMSINTRWRFGSNGPILGYVDRQSDGRFFVGASRNSSRVPVYSRVDARVDRTYR